MKNTLTLRLQDSNSLTIDLQLALDLKSCGSREDTKAPRYPEPPQSALGHRKGNEPVTPLTAEELDRRTQ